MSIFDVHQILNNIDMIKKTIIILSKSTFHVILEDPTIEFSMIPLQPKVIA